jgi:hypothetical protein
MCSEHGSEVLWKAAPDNELLGGLCSSACVSASHLLGHGATGAGQLSKQLPHGVLLEDASTGWEHLHHQRATWSAGEEVTVAVLRRQLKCTKNTGHAFQRGS